MWLFDGGTCTEGRRRVDGARRGRSRVQGGHNIDILRSADLRQPETYMLFETLLDWAARRPLVYVLLSNHGDGYTRMGIVAEKAELIFDEITSVHQMLDSSTMPREDVCDV